MRMSKKVQCPRCGSKDTKFQKTSDDFELDFKLEWQGWFDGIYPSRIYKCNSCALEWDRTGELRRRRHIPEDMTAEEFWEEHKFDFWNSYLASRYVNQ